MNHRLEKANRTERRKNRETSQEKEKFCWQETDIRGRQNSANTRTENKEKGNIEKVRIADNGTVSSYDIMIGDQVGKEDTLPNSRMTV